MAPLNEQQKELLSAFADGEVSDEERLAASELLEREDAQAYLDELQALSDLVHKHGPVRAPVGLSGRVMGALEDDFKSPQAGPGEEPFHGTVTFSWRTPLYAAAAAILVSLAIMFAPSLFSPGEQSGSTVAREVLENLPAEDSTSEKPEGTNGDFTTEDENLAAKKFGDAGPESAGRDLSGVAKHKRELRDAEDALEEEKLSRNSNASKNGMANESEAEEVERLKKDEQSWEHRNAPPEKQGAEDKQAETRREAGENREGGKGVGLAGGLGGGGGRSADRGGSTESVTPDSNDDPAESLEDEDARKRAKQAVEETTEGDDDAARSDADPRRPANDTPADEYLDEEDEKNESGPEGRSPAREPEQDGAVPPTVPQPAPEAPRLRRAAAQEVVEVSLTEGEGILAQNDVLWVSTLYGEADIDEDDEGNENVAVEIPADKLDDLLAALKRLANDQGYGEVEGGPDLQEAPGTEAEPATTGEAKSGRISGYAPAKGEERDPLGGAQQVESKVRVIIRLK